MASEEAVVEYVLGTLPPAERRVFEAAMHADPGLARRVAGWQDRLAPLAETVSAIEPSARVWARIEGGLAGSGDVVAFPLREISLLRRARSRWRATALAAGALAASLLGLIAYEKVRMSAEPTLLAVVNRDGNLPALVVRVDPRQRIVQVRSLAAEVPADGSLQLWSVAAGQAPKSLGLVPAGAGRMEMPSDMGRPSEGGVIAVSVEPRGGSPTGAPTGAVIYSGRLVPDAP